jgi:hypothetical protein
MDNLFIGCEGNINIISLESSQDPTAGQHQLLFVTGSGMISPLQTRAGAPCETRMGQPDPSKPSTRAFETSKLRISLCP